jgi:hypothetical protein
MRNAPISIAIVCALSAGGCNDLSQPWELDHARVLAIRATPPTVAPGQLVEVTALVLTADLTIAELGPEVVRVDQPYDQLLSPTPRSPTLLAADQAIVDQARTLLTLAQTEVIPVPVSIQLQLPDSAGVLEPIDSIKTVRVGGFAENPVAPTVALNGDAVSQLQMSLQVKQRYVLEANVPTDNVNYAWFTSSGELKFPQASRAELVIDKPGTGTILVIARDDKGGVSWNQLSFSAVM